MMREKYQKEQEERKIQEKARLAEEKSRLDHEKHEAMRREDEYRRIEEMKQLEERRMLERQQIESMIEKESKVSKGQVTRRSDDPFGQGFGFVKTGFVSSQKLSFLQRASSVDRYDSRSDLCGVSHSQSQNNGKTKSGLRVTWAESPGSSRPSSNLGWTEKIADMDAQTIRAQTPPLAAEWAVSKGTETKSHSQSTFSFSNNASIASSSGLFKSENALCGSSLLSANNSTVSSTTTNNFSKTSASKMSTSFQSSNSSAFSSSKTMQSSSSFKQSSNMSQTFEAFPGMGGIENMNLEGEKAGK